MKLRNLNDVLDKIFGPFDDARKQQIIDAAMKDFNSPADDGVAQILVEFNSIFNKRSRVVSQKVVNRMKGILKHYSVDEVVTAMRNAHSDEFHRDAGYKHCTMEYFSRMEQIDKWINVTPELKEKSAFVMPRMNVKG
jgi:hypothetical protein